MKIHAALPAEAEVQRPHAGLDVQRLRPGRSGGDFQLRAEAGKVRRVGDLHGPPALPAGFHPDGDRRFHAEILEPRRRAVPHIGDVLAALLLPAAGLGEIGVRLQPFAGAGAVVPPHAVLAPQIAGDPGLVPALSPQRPAVQPAGGHLRLPEAAVGGALQLLRAGLPGVGMAVGLPVVEDVPVRPQVQQPPVGVAQVVEAVFFLGAPVQKQVAQAHQGAAEGEAAVRPVADGVAQLMVVPGGVDKDIAVPILSDGAGLEELVVGEGAGALLGEDHPGPALHGHHILLQLHHRAAVVAQLLEAGDKGGGRWVEPGVQPDPAVIVRQHPGVEGELVALLPPPDGAVRVAHVAQELVRPRRGVADGHPHDPHKVEGVVEVVPPVGAPAHVGGEQQAQAQLVFRVLVFAVDDPLAAPVRQVVHRGGPAHVVVDAEDGGVEFVVGAIDVHPVPEHMGLPIGDIFPAGEIGVKCLPLLHTQSLPVFYLEFLRPA